jgi:hypothetical protein
MKELGKKGEYPRMQISGYSTYLDTILGLSSTASKAEVETESQSHLVVRVQTQDPDIRKVEDFLAGNVPEQGSNVTDLIHKLIF